MDSPAVRSSKDNSESDDGSEGEETETVPWKCDLNKLGWKDGELDWMGGAVEENRITEVLEITPCPYDVPSFWLWSRKTGSRRFISQTSLPNLYELVHRLYKDGKVGSSPASPNKSSVNDTLIGAVIAVRYDIFPNGSAAYLVKWRRLPEMENQPIAEEWVDEKRMPERYIEAHKKRQISDIWEYGPIDIPPTTYNPDSIRDVKLSMPAVSLAPPSATPPPASPSTGSPAAPRASQAFPLSPPQPYSPPHLKLHDDIDSLHDSSDEDDELQKLMDKIKPNQNQSGVSSSASTTKISTQAAKIPVALSQMPSASTKGANKPVSSAKPKVEAPPSPEMATRSSNIQSPATGTLKPKSTSARKEKFVPVPQRSSTGALWLDHSSKGKRKAESLPTPTICKTSEPVTKRPKSNHFHPHKHEEFYHLDGNVIIEIDCSTHFKLHRSRLALQSEYFVNLFERKDGVIDALEMVDGHPLYPVSRVSVKDFAALLGAMNNAITFYYNRPCFDTVASILRASTTLSFPHFRDWAIQYLEEMWSDDLSDLSPDRLSNAVETIILGRNYGISSVLKRAFYELLRTGGLGHQDIANEKDDDEENLVITSADTHRLIRTREKLGEAWCDTLASAFHAFHCPNGPNHGVTADQDVDATATANAVGCPSSAEKTIEWTKLVYASGMSQEYMYDVLCGLKVLVDRDWSAEDGYCQECMEMRRNAWQKQRESLWKKLDLWLEL